MGDGWGRFIYSTFMSYHEMYVDWLFLKMIEWNPRILFCRPTNVPPSPQSFSREY